MATSSFCFPPFRLDRENHVLWHETRIVPLRPKTFAVLSYLVEHAGQLVTRTELRDAVWNTTKVTPQVLRASVWELRQALDDTATQPRFIETVSQKGWRFVASVAADAAPVPSSKFPVPSSWPLATSHNATENLAASQPGTWNLEPETLLVGRETDLAQLHRLLEKAANGERQLVFVTGEPGIGKTALIDAFLSGIRERRTGNSSPAPPAPRSLMPGPWIAQGQCIEHYGVGEAYMPVLAALEQLAQNMADDILITLLQRYAPLWLAQMPSLLEPAARAELQRQLTGATRERMVRELAVLLEVVTTEHPLVLVLEDLHWADASTVELLTYVARRRETARLLVLGAYRPVEMLSVEHPLRHLLGELSAHQQCTELPLAALSETAVATYLDQRFPNSALPVRFAHVLHERTGGNPLFVVTVVEDLVTRELLKEMDGSWSLQLLLVDLSVGVPDSLRHFLTEQMQRLPVEDRRVLEVGSVASAEFSAAAVAAALAETVAEVEERCEHLARQRQFLQRAGISEWPDGTQAARYGFYHALYQQLWHERVTPTRRQQWHRRIGKRLEEAYGQRTSEIAAELAVHFEEGGDYPRAVQYHRQVAANARQRYAYAEAVQHLTTGLSLLLSLPHSLERDRQELTLCLDLGASTVVTQGFAAPTVEGTFARARALCETLNATTLLPSAQEGLWVFHFIRGDLRAALALGETMLQLAQHTQDPLSFVQAHISLGAPYLFLGEFEKANQHIMHSLALYTPPLQASSPRVYEIDPGTYRSYAGFAQLCLGYIDQGKALCEEAVQYATRINHPHSLATALTWAAYTYYLCGEKETFRRHAKTLLALARAHDFPYWLACGLIQHGWTLGLEERWREAQEEISEGLTMLRLAGTGLGLRSGVILLGDVYRREGQSAAGIQLITESLETGEVREEQVWHAELWRLKGELLLTQAQRETLDSL